jgi:ribonuclease P protein subunit POP4
VRDSFFFKADWHGAFVTVIESETPSLVGQCGLVLVERKNTFLIVNKRSELKLLSKGGSVFAMKVNGMLVKLYGNSIRVRASERSVQKFRQKH